VTDRRFRILAADFRCWPFSTDAALQANVRFRGNAEVSRSPGNHNRETAPQASYLATVQEALSGNPSQ